jgi:hypothetical protein
VTRRGAAAFVVVVLTTVLVAACGPQGEPEGTGGASSPELVGTPAPAPTASEASVPAGDTCVIEEGPGPDDVPPADAEIPTTDQGGGRFALCLVGPPGVRVEGTAWCTWTPDRSAVEEVSGLPTTTSRNTTVEGYFDLRTSAIQISLTDPQGTITTYVQASVPGAIRDDGSDGLAAFDAPLDPAAEASPPAGTPPRQTGILRWQCAPPPPA